MLSTSKGANFHHIYFPLWVYYPRFQRGGHMRKTDSEEPNTLQIVIGPCGGDSEHELSTMAVSGLSSDRPMSQEMFFNFPVPVVLLIWFWSIATWIRWFWWRGRTLQRRGGKTGGWWRAEVAHSWMQLPVLKVRFSVSLVNNMLAYSTVNVVCLKLWPCVILFAFSRYIETSFAQHVSGLPTRYLPPGSIKMLWHEFALGCSTIS